MKGRGLTQHWTELKEDVLRLFGREPADARPIRTPEELIDDEFQSMCVPWTDGRVQLLAGFEKNEKLNSVLTELVALKAIRTPLRKEKASAGEIRDAWSGRDVIFDEGDPEIRRRVRAIFAEAAESRASDVLFELSDEACDIYIIANDKKLRLGERETVPTGARMMGYIFHMRDAGSSQTSYMRGVFQGFSLRNRRGLPLPETISGLRCQRGPSEPDRDHMYCRIFYRAQIPEDISLEQLGYEREQADIFAEIRQSLHGAVVIGGTTGDGKSTTLASNLMLQYQENQGQINVVTVEDPVEYPIPGAVQIAVPTTGTGEERAMHYISALMHFCRVHPASGMVSEIRDRDGARQVLQFVDSGHQVWTTIHVSNANGILFRLIDLGVQPGEVCKPGNIALLVKQTLIPILCPHCCLKEPVIHMNRVLGGIVANWAKVRYRNPEGCEVCTETDERGAKKRAWAGYKRPKVVAEMIRPDDDYLQFVRQGDAIGAYRYWVNEMNGVPVDGQIWREIFTGGLDPVDGTRKGATYAQGQVFGERMARQYHKLRERGGAGLAQFFIDPPPDPEGEAARRSQPQMAQPAVKPALKAV